MSVVELRQYTLIPSKSKEFFTLTNDYGDLRKELMPVKGCVLSSFDMFDIILCIVNTSHTSSVGQDVYD